jgi:hypothetical protein
MMSLHPERYTQGVRCCFLHSSDPVDAFDMRQLFPARPTFNLCFPPRSNGSGVYFFPVHQSYRTPVAGIMGALCLIMLNKTTPQIVRHTGIKRSIFALNNVDTPTYHPHHQASVIQ